MNIDWITIAIIIIPSATTLFGSYWQVKTMRAIANPSVNQPNQDTTVGKNRLILLLRIFNFVLSLAMFVWGLLSFKSSPLSSFVLIAFSVGLFVYNVITIILFSVTDKLINIFDGLIGVFRQTINTISTAANSNKNVE
ncbi:MAG: hypothetical protein FJ213_05200 [Ignavibacteria bacterium]|nr:hypothetical protein [Ignavibacteria bacterium]